LACAKHVAVGEHDFGAGYALVVRVVHAEAHAAVEGLVVSIQWQKGVGWGWDTGPDGKDGAVAAVWDRGK
jgi:hypothetical protein